MMHQVDFVTYISTAGKPVREYDAKTGFNERSCSIYLPSGTEYAFGFKNNSESRRRIDITIDGSKTIDSLIVNKFTTIDLERFFDTNKKFMTAVKGDSRVADPTNPDIGKIKIEVYREYEPPKYKARTNLMGQRRRCGGGVLRGCEPTLGLVSGSSGDTPESRGIEPTVVYSCHVDNPILELPESTLLAASSLATVEGKESKQKLVTTHWNGDVHGELLTFWYNILEKNAELQSSTHKFCTSCGNKCELNHRFCAKCGVRF